MSKREPVIFTDLDGTLLDHDTYSWAAARPALQAIRKHHITCILNSSKTFAELVDLALDLQLHAPLICENGGGVAIPAGWQPGADHPEAKPTADGYRLQPLGRRRAEFLPLLAALSETYRFRGFASMTVADVVELTGLPAPAAAKAMQREFTEPCVWHDDAAAFDAFRAELQAHDLCAQRGGRFVHVMGQSDKGRALKWCMQHWFDPARHYSVACGDAENDLPMLNAADVAVVVRSYHHAPPQPATARVVTTDATGPAGWSGAILAEIQNMSLAEASREKGDANGG